MLLLMVVAALASDLIERRNVCPGSSKGMQMTAPEAILWGRGYALIRNGVRHDHPIRLSSHEVHALQAASAGTPTPDGSSGTPSTATGSTCA